MKTPVLQCNGVTKSYSQGPQRVDVLKGVDLAVQAGMHIAIVGASGTGKSTLLNVLGGLDQPDQGEVLVNGHKFSVCSDNQRGFIRNQYLGFVYQFHHLLPEFTALENVMMPLLIGRKTTAEAKAKAQQLLTDVGLANRLEHKPSELSGGERQRVAIARSLANDPACVLMDEPTGNLDTGNATEIQKLMERLSESLDTSFVVVTHDQQFAKTMDQTFHLWDGQLNGV